MSLFLLLVRQSSRLALIAQLPFTLVDTLSWKMIPFVTCYAFILRALELKRSR